MASFTAARRHVLQQNRAFTSDFRGALRAFGASLDGRGDAVLGATAELALDSIVNGSSLTGAPGQPVASGALRDSWRIRPGGPGVLFVETDSDYARVIEYNVRTIRARFGKRGRKLKRGTVIHGRNYRNHGPHSVALTRAALSRLVDAAVQRELGRNP